MQRASHRAIDFVHSDYVKYGASAGTLYRPNEPHTNPTLITPGQAYTYQIEVFPVGHLFRAGHKLVMKVHAPPPADPLSIYAWVSAQPPAQNTIIHADGASSLLLPVLPSLPPVTATAPACGAQIGVPCFKPVA
jgi:predicted acyl esterase